MKYIVVISFLLFVSVLNAQHDVSYDFAEQAAYKRITHTDQAKPGVTKLTTVAQGDACSFTVKNVNTFLYEVSVNGETVALNSDPPQAFQVFFNAVSFAGDAAAVSSSSEVVPSAESAHLSADRRRLISSYKNKLDSFRDSLANLEAWKMKYDGLLNTIQVDGLTGDSITVLVKEFMNGYTPTTVVSYGMRTYNNTLTLLQQAIDAINQLPGEEQKAKQDDLKKLLELQTKIEVFGYPAFFTRFSILHKQALNHKSYYVVSPPVIAEKDYINFKISIQPRKDLKFAQPLQTLSFEYPVRIRNSVKVDFSSGIFVSFNEARGRSYRLDPVPGDSTKVMIAKNEPAAFALPSLGAAIHGSWRRSPSFAFGGMLGIGLNSANITDANFYFGLSFIGGWRERFILNCGFALNHVDYLSKDFYVGQVLRKSDVTTDKLTEKTYRGGPFIALTFNITNKKQSQ